LFYERKQISQGILESLSKQTSPLLQIALIDLLVQREESRSIDILRRLQESDKVNETVRARAGRAIEQLN